MNKKSDLPPHVIAWMEAFRHEQEMRRWLEARRPVVQVETHGQEGHSVAEEPDDSGRGIMRIDLPAGGDVG